MGRAGAPLWTPAPDRAAATRMAALAARTGQHNSAELYTWSITEPDAFWSTVWDDTGVIGHRGHAPAHGPGAFADTTVNMAENLLADRGDPLGDAIIDVDETGHRRTTSRAELRRSVAAAAAALRAEGVNRGDRVAAWMPNCTETAVMAMAAWTIGAIFTSTSPDFGVDGVVDRFGQVEPVILLATDGYRYGGTDYPLGDRLGAIVQRLPSVRRVVVAPRLGTTVTELPAMVYWDEWLSPHHAAPIAYEPLPFDHPLVILYSSGTTGPPKCIVHRTGGVLVMHLKEHQYHCDLRPGDRMMYFTTCGWMMWNWQLSALASGVTIVCYDGNPSSPTPTRLFDLVDEFELDLLGVSAKFIDSCRKHPDIDPIRTHSLRSLRTICSTGSPLNADGFTWVYDHVARDVHLASISGGTDLCGCFVAGDPTQPVFAGEIQGAALAMAVDVLDDDGRPRPPGHDGELVCRPDFPSVPLGFWGDDGARFRAAYLERFDGWWHQGDFAMWTEHHDMPRRGMIIHGRSDATLNAGGVRIGTAELYRVVEQFDEIAECVAIAQRWDDDTRIVLLVTVTDTAVVDPALQSLDTELSERIRSALRTACSPRHVPARIAVVAGLPRTRSNKVSELAVADALNGRPVRNLAALANPEVLEALAGHPALSR